MTQFTKSAFKKQEAGGIIVVVLSFAIAMYARTYYDPETNGALYIRALRDAAWLIFFVGIFWTALSSAHLRTNFFSLEHKLDASIFGLSLIVILGMVILLHCLIMPYIPRTSSKKLPSNPKARERIVSQQKNVKGLVSTAIIISGVVIGSYPVRRFMV